jgi:hypothetical protein
VVIQIGRHSWPENTLSGSASTSFTSTSAIKINQHTLGMTQLKIKRRKFTDSQQNQKKKILKNRHHGYHPKVKGN